MALDLKDRRHSGRVTPRSVGGMKYFEIVEQGLEPQDFWDDWEDYRDGVRGSNDKKQLRSPYIWAAGYLNIKKWNSKLKRLIFRRKMRKTRIKWKGEGR